MQVYLAEGKRVEKRNTVSRIKADYMTGDFTVKQLSMKYNRAYGTIKKIVSDLSI